MQADKLFPDVARLFGLGGTIVAIPLGHAAQAALVADPLGHRVSSRRQLYLPAVIKVTSRFRHEN
jgi:hypothetical protein